MSVRASTWAWQQALQPTPKIVLLALADIADDEGRSWPGVNHLAKKCCVTPRTVQRALRDLQLGGLLKIEARMRPGGRGMTSNLYSLVLGTPPRKNATPANMSPGSLTPPSGEPPTGVSPLGTSVNTPIEAAARNVSAAFEKKERKIVARVLCYPAAGDLEVVKVLIATHGQATVEAAADESRLRGERALPSQVEAILSEWVKAKRKAVAARESPLSQARARQATMVDPEVRRRADAAAADAIRELRRRRL